MLPETAKAEFLPEKLPASPMTMGRPAEQEMPRPAKAASRIAEAAQARLDLLAAPIHPQSFINYIIVHSSNSEERMPSRFPG